jgi:hypothetical protein
MVDARLNETGAFLILGCRAKTLSLKSVPCMDETIYQTPESQEPADQTVMPKDLDYILREVVMVKLVPEKENKDYILN